MNAAIIGVGLTRFGRYPGVSLKGLAADAIDEALADAGLGPDDVEMAFVANTVGGALADQPAVVGQVVLSGRGISGIPVYNVENACAGSSTALNLATHAVAAGAARAVLVVGVEKLYSDDRARTFRALNGAAEHDWAVATDVDLERDSVFVRRVYAARLQDYTDKYGPIDETTLAEISAKNRMHAGFNDKAQYRTPLSVGEILESRVVQPPIRALMCAPIGDGAAAALIVRDDRIPKAARPVRILGSAVSMGSPPPRQQSTISRVAEAAYSQAGVGPGDVDVAEVHDATAFSEFVAYEQLGFCEQGGAAHLVRARDTSLGGRIPVNPSGGLESRGHPMAATGLAQVAELTMQLRNEAGDRQVPEARVALAETAGGFVAGDSAAVAVTILGMHPGA